MNKYDFDGRTAIVTGGAQGIGHAVAEELNKGGARVAIWDTDFELASKTAKELGDGSLSVKADIANWSSVEAAYRKTKDAFGRVDIAGELGRDRRIERTCRRLSCRGVPPDRCGESSWRLPRQQGGRSRHEGCKIMGGSSTSPRSQARKATRMRRPIPRPKQV